MKKDKQHTVPRLYLENFSFKKDNGSYVNVFDRKSSKIFIGNIRDISTQNNFYTVENTHNKYIWEDYYAIEVEPQMKKLIDSILKKTNNVLLQKNSLILDDDMKRELTLVLINQLYRSEASRNFINSIYYEKFYEAKDSFRLKLYEHKDAINLLENLSIDAINKSALMYQILTDKNRIDSMSNYIMNTRDFILFKNFSKLKFISSDNPILFYSETNKSAEPFKNGINNVDTIIYYPISTDLLLMLIKKEHWIMYFGHKIINDREVYFTTNKDIEFIKHKNRLQLENCLRQCYSKNKSDFYDSIL